MSLVLLSTFFGLGASPSGIADSGTPPWFDLFLRGASAAAPVVPPDSGTPPWFDVFLRGATGSGGGIAALPDLANPLWFDFFLRGASPARPFVNLFVNRPVPRRRGEF